MAQQKLRKIPQYTKADRTANDVETLQRELHRLNKLADQRLRNLEKAAGRDGNYNDILNYSYRTAMRDIESMRGSGATRFDTRKLPININSLRANINKVESFLDAPTSTITGITNVYIERTNTFNKNNGTNFTWQEFANFIESDIWEKMNQKFGSSKVINMLTKVDKDINELANSIKENGKARSKIRKMDLLNAIDNMDDMKLSDKVFLSEYIKNTKLESLKKFY